MRVESHVGWGRRERMGPAAPSEVLAATMQEDERGSSGDPRGR